MKVFFASFCFKAVMNLVTNIKPLYRTRWALSSVYSFTKKSSSTKNHSKQAQGSEDIKLGKSSNLIG